MLNHGGQLQKIRARYPQVSGDWLDVSTGIAPWSWPLPELPVSVWQRLPESSEPLQRIAAHYYGCGKDYDRERCHLQAVAGSQVAIELLPSLLPAATVAVPRWGYGEHARSWQRAGHELHFYDQPEQVSQWLECNQVQHVLAINPNNPTGDALPATQLADWQSRLSGDGYLLVDEAFADSEAQLSCLRLPPHPRRIVLRSVGKFFGMAGLRLGFVIADPAVLSPLREQLPLWGISHPAQWLGERMLADRDWQRLQCQRIAESRRQLLQLLPREILARFNIRVQAGPLFVSLFARGDSLPKLHEHLLQQGILTRLFAPLDGESGLRLGLTDEAGLLRLQSPLQQWIQEL